MRHLSLHFDAGIARVTLDSPETSVNILNSDFMADLDQAAAELERQTDIDLVLVRSAKERGFIAGADLRQIADIDDPLEGVRLSAEGQRIFSRWAALKPPVVALVHGHCMGGGTEFALACRYRVAAPNATFSLPEVRLGLLPGWGGTQRLPRLVGLSRAVDIILSGRTVRAREAQKIGLVDRLADLEQLENVGTALGQSQQSVSRGILVRLERWAERWLPVRGLLFRSVGRAVRRQTGGHYPSPLQALEVLRQSHGLTLEAGLQLEAEALGHLVTTPVCKNLVHAFFLNERGKKLPAGLEAVPEIHTAGVLGAGVMGAGIAQWLTEHDFQVWLKDIDADAVERGMKRIREIFRHRLEHRGQLDRMGELMARVTGTTENEAFAQTELVIEAVAERMDIKQRVLQELEPRLDDEAVFATNTSALSVSTLQEVAAHPENVGGLHFFNPVQRMPLVEVIRGRQTSNRTMALLFQVAHQLKKIPIEVRDSAGFLVNRLLGVYLLEACHLAQEGVRWYSLDRMATDFGWPMGPFRLIDEVGIDIIAEVGQTLLDQLPYLKPSDLFHQADAKGLKGRKNRRGFYRYDHKPPSPDSRIAATLGLPEQRPATAEDLQRMLYLMVNEAARCLEEGVVAAVEDIDTGTLFGLGFPPFRGGLARWADSETLPAIRQQLERLTVNGERFTPAPPLCNRTAFYPVPEG